jgi:hypothetical protein
LKPTKKKIVGGSACFTCVSHQAMARRKSAAGADLTMAGCLI